MRKNLVVVTYDSAHTKYTCLLPFSIVSLTHQTPSSFEVQPATE